jgi:hypothetical protein
VSRRIAGMFIALVLVAAACALSQTGAIALNDDVEVVAGETVTVMVLSNDRPPLDGTLTIARVGQARGAVAVDGTHLVYTAPEGFVGEDRFSYSVSAGDGVEVIAYVVVTVTEVDRPTLTLRLTGDGSVRSEPAGVDCPEACSSTYPAGVAVDLEPVPAVGWNFQRWSGDCSGNGQCSVVMSESRSVTALFEREHVSTSVHSTGQGRVVSVPPGIICGSECSADFEVGTIVTLSAMSDSSWIFAGWDGVPCDATGSPTCEFTVTDDVDVIARFQHATVGLTVEVASGKGSVVSDPVGIDCPGECMYEFREGTEVTLTANPARGWNFGRWNGDACQGAGTRTCRVNMTEGAIGITASFVPVPVYGFDVVIETGEGSVMSDPGVDCPGDCRGDFYEGTTVTLAASPAPGWSFSTWGGSCSGTSPTCTLEMNSNWDAVSASFVPVYGFDVVIGDGEGSVLSDPAGVDCPGDCRGDFAEGTTVTLTAVPAPGWSFSNWGSAGSCSGTNPTCTLEILDDSIFVDAWFEPVYGFDVVIESGEGSVLSDPAGVDCPGDCRGDFAEGTTVTLNAVPAPGWIFAFWEGTCSGGISHYPWCTLEMIEDFLPVHAIFEPIIP